MQPETDTTVPQPEAPQLDAPQADAAPAILNLRRGTITLEFGGLLRTLKFGMNTLAAFGQLHMDSPADFSEQFTKNPLGALRDMVFCALSVTKGNQLPAGFDLSVAGDWIDDLRADNPDAWPQIQQVMLHSLSLGAPNRATLAAATPAA